MVKVASFTRYDVKTDRMVQPPYKMLVQALRPQDGYARELGTEIITQTAFGRELGRRNFGSFKK